MCKKLTSEELLKTKIWYSYAVSCKDLHIFRILAIAHVFFVYVVCNINLRTYTYEEPNRGSKTGFAYTIFRVKTMHTKAVDELV